MLIGASLLVVQAALGAATGPATLTTTWQSRVEPRVLQSIDAKQAPGVATPGVATPGVATPGAIAGGFPGGARYDARQRLQVDVVYDCAADSPHAALKSAGMVIGTELHAQPLCVVEGWAGRTALPAIASVDGVRRVDLPRYAKARRPVRGGSAGRDQIHALAQTPAGTPVIDGDGIAIMNADKYITSTGMNGAGITVGVINSDAASLSVIQARNELPAVDVLQPGSKPTPPSSPGDEGTMMLEEVHAVAPGAALAFCGPQTYVEYVSCVQELIAAGVNVITDDLLFPGFDIMTAPADNADTQAVQGLLTANPGVMLFSSAENNAQNYWQGTYKPMQRTNLGTSTCQGQTDRYFEAFNGSTLSNTWSLEGQNETAGDLLLAWPSAGGENASNYDLYVLDKTTLHVIACAAGSSNATGTSTNFTDGGTTYAYIDADSLSSLAAGHSYFIAIGTPDPTLAGGFLKLLGTGDGADVWSSITTGSTASPQVFATGAYAVGAVDGGDGIGNALESYSATGPVQFQLPIASTLQAPMIVAPDDVYVDNTGTHFSTDQFSGTSAASPNSAAVAALLLSAYPTLTAAQTIGYMEAGAAVLPMGTASIPNGSYGYGRVDAMGAFAAIPSPTLAAASNTVSVVGGSTATVPLTLTGAGALMLTVTSDTPTLIAAAPVGLTLSPSDCGTSSSSCSLLISPTLGQAGGAVLTLTVTDGAKRSASVTVAVSVTKPAVPTLVVTAGGSQTFTLGAKPTPVSFSVTGTQSLTVTATSSNTTLLPASGVVLTTGCGGPNVLGCTAMLTLASGQSGSGTVTFAVTDPYGQTANAAASLTVNAPAKSGGGSLDLASLLALGVVLIARGAAGRVLRR